VGDSHFIMSDFIRVLIARSARSRVLLSDLLGFRFAPPQALCFHSLRGLEEDESVNPKCLLY
jgi:hypothetical protein